MTPPTSVHIVEVGPRDGLQNESVIVPTEVKIALIERLAATGLPEVEVTSFVSPAAVPQLADAEETFTRVTQRAGTGYPVLVPNLRGYERARAAGASSIALFTAASEQFNLRNVNATIAKSIDRFREVVDAARFDDVHVRAYVSMAFGCPYEGEIAPSKVAYVAEQLVELGVDELSIGDTIGIGVPTQIGPVCEPLLDLVGPERLALHLHDTRGTALANAWTAFELGIVRFDTCVAGLGGCPFAHGATGNVATEDVVWMLERCGVATGVDLDALVDVAIWISEEIDRPISGHVARVAQRDRAAR